MIGLAARFFAPAMGSGCFRSVNAPQGDDLYPVDTLLPRKSGSVDHIVIKDSA